MLELLINKYGKERISSLTKYPSILTLHKMGERGRLTDELTTPIEDEMLYATEKIDGTNVRILISGAEYVIGSREFLLCHSNDLFYDPALGIVEEIKRLVATPHTANLIVIYGELYGKRISSNSKWYGTEKAGFRVFDICVYDYFDAIKLLKMQTEHISKWRERETDNGMVYGQPFLTRTAMKEMFPQFEYVPDVALNNLTDFSHQGILDTLRASIPSTNVALSDTATGKAEGLILRNEDRSKIVKVRFEDYERTLR